MERLIKMAYSKLLSITGDNGRLPQSIQTLNLSTNLLSNIDLTGMFMLTHLNLYGNELDPDLNLSWCQESLVNLNVDNNPNLHVILFDRLSNCIYFSANGTSLRRHFVDLIIDKLNTNGYSAGYCYLAQGTSESPTPRIIALDELLNKEWQVVTN